MPLPISSKMNAEKYNHPYRNQILKDKLGNFMSSEISNNKEIIINLDEGFGLKNLKENHLIQQEAYNFLKNKVEKRLSIQDEKNGKVSDDGVFFLNGTRGAGKSAFLNSVIELIKDQKDNKGRLAVLINIDPTKVETGENIFVSIIQKLAESVENHCKINFKHHMHQSDTQYESWRKKLKTLAGGISLIDKKYNGIEQLNEDSIALDWGMKNVKSGLSLADSFKDLVKEAQKILEVSAFIVAIDDADTDFTKGKEVLELIRRYLDIPQLIIFVAGDLRLYTHLVRDMFAENLYKSHNLNSDIDKKNRMNLLDHMVDQYLKKVFPIQNRVELKTLKVLNDQYHYTITVDGENYVLSALVDKIIQDGLSVKSPSDIKSYRDFLLSQPIRSIVQLLYLCTSYVDLSDEEEQVKLSNKIEDCYFSKSSIAEAFRQIFFDDLYRYQIDTDGLSNKDISVLNHSVFNAVIKDGEFDTGCYLRPQPKEDNLKSVFVALASNVAWQTQNNLGAILDYMMQGVGSQFIYNLCRSDFSSKFVADEQIDNFKNYFSIGRNEDPLNWAWHYCGSLNFESGKNRIHAGVIGLNLKTPKQDRKKINYKLINTLRNQISKNKKDLPIIYYSLVQIAASVSELYSSIFNILGLVSKILHSYNVDQSQKSIHDIIKKQENTVSISPAPWRFGQSLSIDVIEESIDEHEEENTDSGYNNITDAMYNWCKHITDSKNSLKPSAVLIGKIWTRLFFSVLNISDKNRSSNQLATIMELYALAVINAFLVEEIDHHIIGKDDLEIKEILNNVDRKNPLTNSSHVINKFQKLSQLNIKEDLPLTYMIATCPMLLGLLSSDNANSLLEAVKFDVNFEGFLQKFNDNFDDLNTIYIAAK